VTLALTPQRIAAVYHCLRTFPPFTRMKCPADIKFQVSHHKDREGHYTRYCYTDKHFLSVSAHRVGYFDNLAQVVAHEMIHVHQGVAKTETPNTHHNAEFHRIAKAVCKRFGWDPKLFVA
jgi:hypothetical protein